MAVDRQTGDWIVDGMKYKIIGYDANRRVAVRAELRAPMTDALESERSERRRAVRDAVRSAAEQDVDGMAEYRRLSKCLRDQKAEIGIIEHDRANLARELESAIRAADSDGMERAERGLKQADDALAVLRKRLGILKNAVEQLAEELNLKLRKAVRTAANARRIAILEELEEIEATPPDAVAEWLSAVWGKRVEIGAADSFRDVYADRDAANAILAGATE